MVSEYAAGKGVGIMDYSRKILERLWNIPDKGELESRREETFIDDIIQKSHIEKELLSHLDETCEDPFVKWCIDNKENAVEAFHFSRDAAMKLYKDGLMGGESESAEYENGGTPWCITYTFMPDELEEILKHYGVKNIKLAGPGAYARTLPRELNMKLY